MRTPRSSTLACIIALVAVVATGMCMDPVSAKHLSRVPSPRAAAAAPKILHAPTAPPLSTAAPTTAAATPSHASNPHHRRHRVSMSSYHTSRGIERDSTREYANAGQSHERHFSASSKVDPKLGQHLFEPKIHAVVSAELAAAFGNASTALELLPSITAAGDGTPEQIRLSLTARAGELVISWLTWNSSASPIVSLSTQSGGQGHSNQFPAQTVNFVDPNTLHLVRYIHNALLTDLKPSSTYYYSVGDAATNVWSPEFSFTTVPAPGSDSDEVQNIILYGDLGLVNSVSMEQISQEVAAGDVNAVIHIGDFAYNMDELQGITGDVFLREMQNITSAVPFMGCAGNHEAAFNFSHYTNKFSAWNYVSNASGAADNNWWYSLDMQSGGALMHLIFLDSEVYYWNYYEPHADAQRRGYFQQMIKNQWNWLVNDLTDAYDSGKYSWIMAFAHRPIYCSNVDGLSDCTTDAELLRKGPGGEYGWEEAFTVRPLDVFFAAHEHSYERTYPVFNGSVDWAAVSADGRAYTNPRHTVHIIAGSAGCREFFDWFDEVFYGPWSAVRSKTYGYGHLVVHNATHLYWEQLLDEGNGGVDPLWIIKDASATRGGKKIEQANPAASPLPQQQQSQQQPLAMMGDEDAPLVHLRGDEAHLARVAEM